MQLKLYAPLLTHSWQYLKVKVICAGDSCVTGKLRNKHELMFKGDFQTYNNIIPR